MRNIVLCGLVAVAVLSTGCATTATSGGSGSRYVLTADEITSVDVSTAYQLIQRLRPQFLRSRGAGTPQNPSAQVPVVFVNGMRYGSLDSLHSIAAEDVQEVRYLSARDATTRFGTGYTGGVIMIKTKT